MAVKRSMVDVPGALQRTLAALEADGRLSESDDALVELAKGIAEALKLDPTNAALWREYRMAIESLMRVEGGGDDETKAFWVTLRTAVGDTPDPEKGHARPSGGSRSRIVGPAADAVATNGRKRRP